MLSLRPPKISTCTWHGMTRKMCKPALSPRVNSSRHGPSTCQKGPRKNTKKIVVGRISAPCRRQNHRHSAPRHRHRHRQPLLHARRTRTERQSHRTRHLHRLSRRRRPTRLKRTQSHRQVIHFFGKVAAFRVRLQYAIADGCTLSRAGSHFLC